MSHYTITLPSGVLWTPKFISSINQEKCIGCGRCFKTCARDVLQLMAEGKATKEIAAALKISVKTVETYKARVMEKLNLRSRAALVRFALQHGLLDDAIPGIRARSPGILAVGNAEQQHRRNARGVSRLRFFHQFIRR